MSDADSEPQCLDDLPPLQPGDAFRFACHAEVACFNACCRDLDLELHPYDVLVLRTALGLSSTDFLERYGVTGELGQTGFPVVQLAMGEGSGRPCPFVRPEGCSVYLSRPAACRSYPIARGAGLDEQGQLQERLCLVRESHCQGFEQLKQWTVQGWLDDQRLAEHTTVDDRYMSLVARHLRKKGPLPAERKLLVAVALYQVDHLVELWERQNSLADLGLSPEREAAVRTDERARLDVALDWLELTLLGDDQAPQP
jgi:Fe-S-cluster containining protein